MNFDGIAQLPPDCFGVYHPDTEDEIREYVLYARAKGLKLRVRGAGLSTKEAVYTDKDFEGAAAEEINLCLDRMKGIEFDDDKMQATVQSGCRFGSDANDPGQSAKLKNSLCYQLDKRGWALPVLGGVLQESVGGYILVGAHGSSMTHSLEPHILALRLMDGEGKIHDISRELDEDLFNAAGVSLGLLGIILSVTFQCVERFDVMGRESIHKIADSEVDLFSSGEKSIGKFLKKTEYSRALWWPQPKVDKLVVWQARKMQKSDYGNSEKVFARKPYFAFPPLFNQTMHMQVAASLALTLLGSRLAGAVLPNWLRSAIFNAFVTTDKAGPQEFRDSWQQALPMDNQINHVLIPTDMMEFWFPADSAQEVMNRLKAYYSEHGFDASGTFAVELYASPQSKFWLSPSYGHDAVRVNFFWFKKNFGHSMDRFFPQFLELFKDMDFRLHWGKRLFKDPREGLVHFRKQYPRLNDFMQLRSQMDPGQIFVTRYWREHLGIPDEAAKHPSQEDKASAPKMVLPKRSGKKQFKWPLLFPVTPSDRSFAEEAEFVFENSAIIDVSPEELHPIFTLGEGDGRRWIHYYCHTDWLMGVQKGCDLVYDATLFFMTMRFRVIYNEPLKGWTASVEACSIPLATKMVDIADYEALEDGRTKFRWRIFYNPINIMRPFHPFLRPFFSRLFRISTKKLAAYMIQLKQEGYFDKKE